MLGWFLFRSVLLPSPFLHHVYAPEPETLPEQPDRQASVRASEVGPGVQGISDSSGRIHECTARPDRGVD